MFFLQVVYENDVAVDFGNELAPTQVKHAPKLSWNAEADSLYTLCMIGAFLIYIFSW